MFLQEITPSRRQVEGLREGVDHACEAIEIRLHRLVGPFSLSNLAPRLDVQRLQHLHILPEIAHLLCKFLHALLNPSHLRVVGADTPIRVTDVSRHDNFIVDLALFFVSIRRSGCVGSGADASEGAGWVHLLHQVVLRLGMEVERAANISVAGREGAGVRERLGRISERGLGANGVDGRLSGLGSSNVVEVGLSGRRDSGGFLIPRRSSRFLGGSRGREALEVIRRHMGRVRVVG
jgi:hypothetical protein